MSTTNVTPVAPLTTREKVRPVWATSVRRYKAVKVALDQYDPLQSATPPHELNAHVDYDPSHSDLVRHVLDFRTLHGYWKGMNVAVAEYTTTSGETMIVVASSTQNGSHSEEKLLLYLQSLQDSGQLASVSRLYSERAPCQGIDNGHNCDCMVHASPFAATAQFTYSFEYERRVEDGQETRIKEEERFDTEREAHQGTANTSNGLAQVRAGLGPNVIHILPANSQRDFPLAFDDRERDIDRRPHPSDAMPSRPYDQDGVPHELTVIAGEPDIATQTREQSLDVRSNPSDGLAPREPHTDNARAYRARDLAAMIDPNAVNGDGTRKK